jgi:gp16 family phage-associated protein
MNADTLNKKIKAHREKLLTDGESGADFCRRRGLEYDAYMAVLRGRAKGKRGQSHKVFAALGLK